MLLRAFAANTTASLLRYTIGAANTEDGRIKNHNAEPVNETYNGFNADEAHLAELRKVLYTSEALFILFTGTDWVSARLNTRFVETGRL